ncbi:TonB-dependent receptor [Sphingomonas kyungheensis]|uniref:TonB-dependent receptor n=1 Tax=Sphingomonas kyungheensis TaxID=1069987 RepID=A0ABU8GZ75_9SPHN
MKRTVLWASAAPLSFVAAHATAQTLTPRQVDLPSIVANAAVTQSKSGDNVDHDGAAAANLLTDEDAQTDDIVVTGYRASLGTAQGIKRNSDAIVDVVVAQDIGKLPDNTAAESLARVTGIQVSRYSDEVNGVLVRGLPDVATTVNGRDIFTAEGRRVALQDFPAGALQAIEVYKSGTANLLEPGLAGLINVRSFRPFDFTDRGLTLAGGLRGTYNDQDKKKDPSGNLLLSYRADTPVGEIGVLINGSYTQSTYRNAVRYGEGFIASPADGTDITVLPPSVGMAFKIPYRIGVYNDSGRRWRPAANASVQWKPASNFELYYDFIYQGYRGDTAADWFGEYLLADKVTLSKVVLKDGHPDQVSTLTKSGGDPAEMYRSTTHGQTDTLQAAGGGKWDIGRAHLSTDLAYTRSRYTSRAWSFDSKTAAPLTTDVNFFVDNGVSFSAPGFDAANPANYIWRGYYEADYVTKGAGWQWRADLDLDTDLTIVPRLQFGVRYTNRDASLQNGNRYAYTPDLNIPLDQTPTGTLSLTQNTFRGNQGFTGWLMPSRDGIAGNALELRQYAYHALQQLVMLHPDDSGYQKALTKFSPLTVQHDPLAAYYAREKTFAFYGQGKYEFEIGDIRFDGLFGARVINTVGLYSGTSNITIGTNTFTKAEARGSNYLDILPNISLRIRPTEKFQIRFGATKTVTRPSFQQLNPAVSLSENTSSRTNADGSPKVQVPDTQYPIGLQGRPDFYASGGNPNLVALTSRNYDASFEYYFSKNASLTAAIFYRDLFGFTSNYTTRVADPVYGVIEINQPANAGAGRIKGVEVGGQSFLAFLPGLLSGLGIQANATYLQGTNQYPVSVLKTLGATGPAPFVKIPGLSKWSYNVALFFEKGAISTRLSYNGRSSFLNGNFFNPSGKFVGGEGTLKVVRLDYSFNYTPVPAITLTVDATNLLATPFNNYRQYAPDAYYPRDIRDEGRYYGLGARFRF